MFGGTVLMKLGLFFCLVVVALIEPTRSITTTHHSIAPHRRPTNQSLTLPERQKRLLPYYNFYLAQDINRPIAVVRRYKKPPSQPVVQIAPPPPRLADNFTPFLESNALPGPFIPIQQPVQQHYGGGEEQVPNYSAIYDKLSQLKLVQRRPQQYQQQQQQSYHVIPGGRPQYTETDHNSIQQGKTIIQTYTPTQVEVSSSRPPLDENEVYVSTLAPKHENEIYITTPPPYQLYNLVHQDHIQPLTVDDINQYEKDKNQYIDSRKPIIVYQQQQPEQIQRPVIFLPPPPPSRQPEKTSLDTLLKKLQASNTLPQTLTTDNIDNSIKTLVKILSGLKKDQKFTKPIVVADETDYVDNTAQAQPPPPSSPVAVEEEEDLEMYPPDTVEGGTPGRPGVDYPALSSIPQTSFNCKTQRYKGFFGDPDTNCQVWHYCDLNGGQASFLCPNGTIFSQVALTCDWWFNVKCSTTAQLYVLNERLYKYILPLSPKFPEDYSGPLVDKYLAIKFKEMEEKMKKQKKGKTDDKKEEITTVDPNYMTKLEDAE